MTDKQKQRFIEEYNAAELLHSTGLIDENVYRKIENTLLRTIIGHFALECCNKESIIPSDSEKDDKVRCTECPFFKYTDGYSECFYGAKCGIDNHEAEPSFKAIESIKSLYNKCPLAKGSEEQE